eukprot:947602-Prymnesium_polylepis.1
MWPDRAGSGWCSGRTEGKARPSVEAFRLRWARETAPGEEFVRGEGALCVRTPCCGEGRVLCSCARCSRAQLSHRRSMHPTVQPPTGRDRCGLCEPQSQQSRM